MQHNYVEAHGANLRNNVVEPIISKDYYAICMQIYTDYQTDNHH